MKINERESNVELFNIDIKKKLKRELIFQFKWLSEQ